MNEKTWQNHEGGSVLIVALIMLVLLTLLGIAATTTTEIEMQIAGNERLYKQNLYSAEAVAMECAQSLEDTDLEAPNISWLFSLGSLTKADIRLVDTGDAANPWENPIGVDNTIAASSATVSNARYLVVKEGIAAGTSLGLGAGSQVHSYAVYGRRYNAANPNLGRAIINLGYRKAF